MMIGKLSLAALFLIVVLVGNSRSPAPSPCIFSKKAPDERVTFVWANLPSTNQRSLAFCSNWGLSELPRALRPRLSSSGRNELSNVSA